jgi:hypothetical protein
VKTLFPHPQNPRYFTDGTDRAIYLTGSHTWANLQDFGVIGEPPFDYQKYLHILLENNHNFMRMWAIEHSGEQKQTGKQVFVEPLPYQRTGPGIALDGKPKFDLTKPNSQYFERLRNRIISARDFGIYVSIMLFLWYSVGNSETDGNRWKFHPFNIHNNINGVDGDPNGRGNGSDLHTLIHPKITDLQKGYIRQVIDTVNDLDNVLYEIVNESTLESKDWQYHMIEYIHTYEGGKPFQHPVGMTAHMDVGVHHGNYNELLNSPAEWISPSMDDDGGNWREDPQISDGRKVILTDTDHLWGIGGDRRWVWKSFCRGLNPIFMDPWQPWPEISDLWKKMNQRDFPIWENIRLNMGFSNYYAKRLDLVNAHPSIDVSGTRYALVNPGKQILVYQPTDGNSFAVFLKPGIYHFEWFDPVSCKVTTHGTVKVIDSPMTFTPPFINDAVLYICQREDVEDDQQHIWRTESTKKPYKRMDIYNSRKVV